MRHCNFPSLTIVARAFAVVLLAFVTQSGTIAESEGAQQQVFAAERAFAKSMADRDRVAFAKFVSDEAIFFGSQGTQRGKAEVVGAWSSFFEGPTPPFSWDPDQVEVLPSGTLALSTGLVRDPAGKVVARFNSIWRLEAPGTWRVIFDKGSPPSTADLK